MIYIFASIIACGIGLILFVSLREEADFTGLAIAAMLAFGLLILFASRRIRTKYGENDAQDKSYINWFGINSLRQTHHFNLGIGILFYVLAITDYVTGYRQSSTGRWAWLRSFMIEIFGSQGPIFLYVILGTVLILWAVLGLTKRSNP